MTLEEEHTERILAFLRRETSLVPDLFKDIAEMYNVNLPIFIIDNKAFSHISDVEVNGKIVTLLENVFSDPIAICLNIECSRYSSRGFKLSEFNSKLLTHLHEITHIVHRDEIKNYLIKELEGLKRENVGIEGILAFRDLTHLGIEKRITKIAHSEYKKLRPYIHKDEYEWKNGKKPDIEIVKYDFFSV